MSTSPTPDIPPQLAKFPSEVREAYQRFRTSSDAEALQTVVFAALREFLPQRCPVDRNGPLSDQLRLKEDLGYDSLAVAEFVFFFEDLFQVTIDDRELLSVSTVGDLRSFVARKLSSKNSTAPA